jgi:hypothetical protein
MNTKYMKFFELIKKMIILLCEFGWMSLLCYYSSFNLITYTNAYTLGNND